MITISTQKMKLLITTIFFLLFINECIGKFCSCGRENVNSRIVGGSVASENKYPWMVFLKIERKDKLSFCGGSLINDRYVLSAAHCTTEMKKITAYLGSNKPFQGEKIEVDEVVEYVSSFNPYNFHYDLVLLKLSKPVQFNSEISPICLPTPDMVDFTNLTVAGWGKTEISKIAYFLREVEVHQTPFDECNRFRGYVLANSQLCAADNGKGACFGDSGGPLMVRQRGKTHVVGIVSFGSRNCRDRYTVFTRVTSYLDWIERETRDAEYCTNNIDETLHNE